MPIPDTGVYQMSWHIWLLNPYIDFWATMYSFYFSFDFYSFICNFQLSTNKNAVVVVLLPIVQMWTSGHTAANVVFFNLLCQLILWSNILVTGLLKVAKTRHLLCDVICLLSYSHVADSLTKYCKISCLHIEMPTSRLCDDLVGNIIYD